MTYRLGFWLLFLASLVLFFTPITVAEAEGFGLDKIVHVVLFAGLFYLGDKAFNDGIASSRKSARLAMTVLLAIYAFGIEYIQHLLPWRSFDVWDAVAGVAGVVVATSLLTSPHHLGRGTK